MSRRVLLLAQLAVALAWSSGASAQGSESEDLSVLVERLRSSDDFRVRTQAALALGASANQEAAGPLCAGLDDANTTVRAASAAALGRLALGGDCLNRRLAMETSEDVKSVIRRSLENLAAAQEQPGIGPDTKVYVAIGDITNTTSRPTDGLNTLVRGALAQQFSQLGGFAVAPASESLEDAKKLLDEHPSVKAIFVWPKVQFAADAGGLKLSLELSLFTYPGKAFKGSMTRSLTMPDTPLGDTSSEDELIRMAAERLAPDLAKTAAQI